MKEIAFLNEYIAHTEHELRIVTERYHSGSLRAFVLPDYCATFFVDNLLGDDFDAASATNFLDDVLLFPAAQGYSLEHVLRRLDRKLAVMFCLQIDLRGETTVERNFTLQSPHGDDIHFEYIVNDLSLNYKEGGWYDWLEQNMSSLKNSYVYDLLNYEYPADLKDKLKQASSLD